MTREELIQKLREGYELANRGTGWWLSAPRKPYGAIESVKVDDSLIDALVKEKVVRVDMPYTTAKAALI